MTKHKMSKNAPLRLAIAAILKNEAPYIGEWVAYHRALGVDQFFLADNNSDDGTTEILASLHGSGSVVHIPFPHVPDQPPQLAAYAEIMHRHRQEADWFAFIDADEFIYPTNGERSIKPTIERLAAGPAVGAIAIHWATFGSSGNEIGQPKPVIERFYRRAEQHWSENLHYKSIVRSDAFVSPHGNPHLFILAEGQKLVDTVGREIVDNIERGPGLSSAVCWDGLRLNHYATKSRGEFFGKKAPRGSATTLGRTKGGDYFRHHDRNEVEDPMPQWLLEQTSSHLADLTRSTAWVHVDLVDAAPPALAQNVRSIRGFIDELSIDGDIATVTGWALLDDGRRVPKLTAQVGDHLMATAGLRRVVRPDVERHFSGVAPDSGFILTLPLYELPSPASVLDVVTVYGSTGSSFDMRLSESMAWKGRPTEAGRRVTPEVPSVAVPKAPAMPELPRSRLYECMAESACYLEYGTGGSTVKAFEQGIPTVLGVESDAAWLARVRDALPPTSITINSHLVLSDIGKTKELGYPVTNDHWDRYWTYSLDIWNLCERHDYSPDLILIDGRFRVSCMLATLLFARPGAVVLFDDYIDRSYYHDVERFARRHSIFDRMCEFRVPEQLPRDAVWLALMAAVADPR